MEQTLVDFFDSILYMDLQLIIFSWDIMYKITLNLDIDGRIQLHVSGRFILFASYNQIEFINNNKHLLFLNRRARDFGIFQAGET